MGESVYERKLRPLLEVFQSDRYVFIHLPSEDYFVGDSLLEASDRLREKYPNAVKGEVYARRVGHLPVFHAHTPRITKDDL